VLVSVRPSVHLSVACFNLTRERKGLGSPKLAGWKIITRVRLKVTRPINAVRESASCLPNKNCLRTSNLVARSRDASDSCWLISQERKVVETSELVGRLHTPRAIKRTGLKVKGQTSLTNAETGSASYLPNGKAYELLTWYLDPYHRQEP